MIELEFKERAAHRVSVRDLVEFLLRSGDLVGESDFSGPSRGLEGASFHRKLQSNRPEGYQSEVFLSHIVTTAKGRIEVQGRIDGLWTEPQGLVLEEIKTLKRAWSGQANPLHWAQLKVYGAIVAREQRHDRLDLQLLYHEIHSGRSHPLRQSFWRTELEDFFDALVEEFSEWTAAQFSWIKHRNESLKGALFPFSKLRPGQREIMELVSATIASGGRAFIEAPTGIGKTLSALFPAVRSLADGAIGKIFYLTAKTSGRAIAEQAIAEMRNAAAHLRAVTLTARERLCPKPPPLEAAAVCDPRLCPHAKGYYDRLKPALREALNEEQLNREAILRVAASHQICPHALSMDLVPWADLVIGDFNHGFDPSARLNPYFSEGNRSQFALLVDEAHNLPDRAREMFSATLDAHALRAIAAAVELGAPGVAQSLNSIAGKLRSLAPEDPESPIAYERSGGRWFPHIDADGQRRWIARHAPAALVDSLEAFLAQAETFLSLEDSFPGRTELMEAFFEVFAFNRVLESFASNYAAILDVSPTLRLRLFCADASPQLGAILESLHAAIFFSGTLGPLDYYRAQLGGAEGDHLLELPSPYPTENLRLVIHRRLSTDYKTRRETAAEVARALQLFVAGNTGNYLIFFPSYKYLAHVEQELRPLLPSKVELCAQSSRLSERDKEAFLARFAKKPSGTLVGLAVLGGIFSEGIDLVGDRLCGVAVVGVGLPQKSVERELIRQHLEDRRATGFAHAYAYPGMTRVRQAVGRLIRSEVDRGVALLIDSRYDQPIYRSQLPAWWHPVEIQSTDELPAILADFWAAGEPGQGRFF